MAIAELKKIRILAHQEIRQALIDELQQSGMVHITDLKEVPEVQELGLDEFGFSTEDIAEELSQIEYTLNFLEPYKPPPQSWRDKLGQAKAVKTKKELERIVEKKEYRQIYKTCRKLDEGMLGLSVAIDDLQVDLATLTHWEKLDFPIETLTSSKHCQLRLLKLPQELKQEQYQKLTEAVGELFDLRSVSERHGFCHELLVYLAEHEDKINPILITEGVETVNLPKRTGTPAQIINDIKNELTKLKSRMEKLRNEALLLAAQKEKVALAYDYFVNQKLKQEIQGSFLATKSAFFLEGWVKRQGVKKLQVLLKGKFTQLEILISEPEKDEAPPIDFNNNQLVAPFEAITKLYGLPRSDELDPTPLFAPFFFVFFGLCLTDSGYGLLLVGIAYFGLRYLLLDSETKGMLKLLFLSGVAAIIAGAITGSWFGDIVNFLPAVFMPLKTLKNSLIIFDPINDPTGPMTFMLISLVLGFVQVCFGIGIKMYAEFRSGNTAAAIFDYFPWMLIFAGLGLWGLQFSLGAANNLLVVKGLIYSGFAIILLFNGREYGFNIFKRLGGGLLGLYCTIGYFSDILSYSRLLALGLATGVIATVVNKIAFMTTEIPVIGYIFMLLILIGGHIFNLAISGLGAFVHTSRLQFVEFFPKFFQGGGEMFNPFKWKSKYSVIKD